MAPFWLNVKPYWLTSAGGGSGNDAGPAGVKGLQMQIQLPGIAVLGAGHVGPVIARIAVAAGYPVAIAASGDPEKIALMTQVLVPGAETRWAADAVKDADIVVLSIPLHRFPAFDPDLVAGTLVVDAMNYWPPGNGVLGMFEDPRDSSPAIAHRPPAP